MTAYVALLYSVVIDKTRRAAMADLRAIAERLGHRHVRTLVSTGNRVFDADNRPIAELENARKPAIAVAVS